MWSESKRKYFRNLGYSEPRIKSLEAAESATKATTALIHKTRPNPILAAMRSRTKAAPTRPNPITPPQVN